MVSLRPSFRERELNFNTINRNEKFSRVSSDSNGFTRLHSRWCFHFSAFKTVPPLWCFQNGAFTPLVYSRQYLNDDFTAAPLQQWLCNGTFTALTVMTSWLEQTEVRCRLQGGHKNRGNGNCNDCSVISDPAIVTLKSKSAIAFTEIVPLTACARRSVMS